MSDEKEFKQIRDELIKAGWRVVKRGGHYRAYPPDKSQPPLTFPSSPGGGRGFLNFKADLKRRGWKK